MKPALGRQMAACALVALLAILLSTFSLPQAIAQTSQADQTDQAGETAGEAADTRPDASPVDDDPAAGVWRHAVTLGEEPPRYDEGFDHFGYVNPQAPKGGLVRLSDLGTFDTLNIVPARGVTPLGLGLIYDSLMVSSQDELSTDYGLLAEAMRYPDDFSSVTYRLREGAQWHDGEPITPRDVVFSFNALVEHSPQQAAYYSHVSDVAITGERDITFTFDQTGNRELPLIVGQLTVLPEHWWTGVDANGNQRNIARGTLEVPLGSGPYRIAEVSAGRSITMSGWRTTGPPIST
jgi:microcin C transport system substrate-binding protein